MNGPEEVKKHPWLKDLNWKLIKTKKLVSPFIPNDDEDNFDIKLNLVNDPWKDADSDAIKESLIMLENKSTQELFSGYFYDVSQSNNTTEMTNKLKSN